MSHAGDEQNGTPKCGHFSAVYSRSFCRSGQRDCKHDTDYDNSPSVPWATIGRAHDGLLDVVGVTKGSCLEYALHQVSKLCAATVLYVWVDAGLAKFAI